MVAPDFFLSRRQLRRARIQEALGLPRQVNVTMHRNRLLERLVLASDEESGQFDSLPEDTVDTVVSLALAELDEPAVDALVVVLLCVKVLAADGQFARLALLAARLRFLGDVLQVERPFLALATRSLATALQGQEAAARRQLDERLGVVNTGRTLSAPRSREHANDLLMAGTVRSVVGRDEDSRFALRAREAALQVADGLLFAFVDCVIAWHQAVARARPAIVLTQSDPTFQAPALVTYLQRLRIPALYAPQIRAIQGGATRDVDLVVSLPTSSGKTLIAEFRIAAALTRDPGSKAIYVAPYRLLARQVERSFRATLGNVLKLDVQDLGSGFDPTYEGDKQADPDVAICTPERLDALLRLASSSRPGHAAAAALFDSCSVLVFDELQLVGRAGRGPRFELILTRLRAKYPSIRLLGLSAAAQGADDVARWLTGQPALAGARRPTGTLEILWETGGALRQRVSGRAPTGVAELPRKTPVDDAAMLILHLREKYRPVLAVEPSRGAAEGLAKKVMAAAPGDGATWRAGLSPSEVTTLTTAIQEVKALLGDGHPLAQYMENGIAFHHAGVPTHVLQQIEQLAAARLLRVVCATTTVAEGADLPFRVVVIPHLNFPGSSRQLERDLYLNIIGRAGRANVSVEGIVFVLESGARTLQHVVRASLWSTVMRDRVQGRLADIAPSPETMDAWGAYQEMQSQVMAWLGDADNYVDEQAGLLASKTFTFESGVSRDKRAVVGLFTQALEDLESQGYALAASPYRLTARGQNARLTGLSTASVARLEAAVDRGRSGWLQDLVDLERLTPDLATQLAQLLFEGVEVFEHSLWLRRNASTADAKFEALRSFAEGRDESHQKDPEFESDVELLAEWILGAGYVDLARRAPTYNHANSLFGGTVEPKRTSDATEYIGKLTYPASWVWSGVIVLAGDLGQRMPAFLRQAIELGLPTEAATRLVSQGGLTRPAAIAITDLVGDNWAAVREWFQDPPPDEALPFQLTQLDLRRLRELQERVTQDLLT